MHACIHTHTHTLAYILLYFTPTLKKPSFPSNWLPLNQIRYYLLNLLKINNQYLNKRVLKKNIFHY
jgi:hypothetical protein|uniref:Uncharacterized protein n=1 Tax=Populus trichocarpa TaxID=3694 RepID=A0A3N7FLD9_POPTR